jgi:Asp-tRNA(Asn)/Glu-tRNA(Gln) amidotransferase A subunit family amidase
MSATPHTRPESERSAILSRRRVLQVAVAATGSAVYARALAALAQDRPQVTEEILRQAEWIAGIPLDEEKRKLMLQGLGSQLEAFQKLRAVAVDNSVPPAVWFRPARVPRGAATTTLNLTAPVAERPASDDELAFASVAELAGMLRGRKISATELSRFYLDRLKKFGPVLQAVVTLTEELAMRQAAEADRRLATGRRGVPPDFLLGIPWGAKDLLAVPGYPTTWGAPPYKDQVRPEKAAVVEKLEQAGAVLVAKLTLGSLAWGDVWFGGVTKNPWKPDQGSSGSSAGSAAATAAGLVSFAIGSETLGSIVSPCTRCGVTGLRPTFGRISKHGAMALAWTMDKLGPIARSAEDCALIFAGIHGADPRDPSSVGVGFRWPVADPRKLRVGYLRDLFEEDRAARIQDEQQKELAREWQRFDNETLETLRRIGFDLIPLELPGTYPVDALRIILNAEAAACFDDLTRSGRDAELVRQERNAWPTTFRNGQMIPAVEYIRANRIRSMVMTEMEEWFRQVDVYVAPSFGGQNLLLTNLTGHPAVVVPNGFRAGDGTPTSITFTGRLWGEAEALAVAHAYQQATDFHRRRPTIPLPE